MSSSFLFLQLPPSPSVPHCSSTYSCSTHRESHVYRHTPQTATIVSLWCIKTNISSLQINYQLSPWSASVISLSGSRSNGICCVLSTWADSYFPLSRGLSTPPPPPLLPHCLHTARGDRMNL